MQGLRTKEEHNFLKFFEKVQDKAKETDSVFFLDSGECKDIEFEEMIIDEISGWLVPISRVKNFETKFINNRNLDEFEDLYIWCIPKIEDNKLIIEFKNF